MSLTFILFVIIIPLMVAGSLVYPLIKFMRMREDRLEKAYEKVLKLKEDGKLDEAEKILYLALKNVGWDYQRYLQLKKFNRLAMISETQEPMVTVARILRVLPKNNFDWVADKLFFLGEIYHAQNKQDKQFRLYSDVRNFIDDYGTALNRLDRLVLLARISTREAKIEFEKKNYRSSIRLKATAFLYRVEYLFGAALFDQLKEIIPYQGSELVMDALKELSREGDCEELFKIVQNGIIDDGARIELRRVQRDLDDFFQGRRTTSDVEREAARLMLQKVLQKAEKAEGKKNDSEDEGKSGPDNGGVILL